MAKSKKELVDRLKDRFLKEGLNLVNYDIPTTNGLQPKPLSEIFLTDYELIKPHILKERIIIKNLYTGAFVGSFKIRKHICECGFNQHLVTEIREKDLSTECLSCSKPLVFVRIKEKDDDSESEIDSVV